VTRLCCNITFIYFPMFGALIRLSLSNRVFPEIAKGIPRIRKSIKIWRRFLPESMTLKSRKIQFHDPREKPYIVCRSSTSVCLWSSEVTTKAAPYTTQEHCVETPSAMSEGMTHRGSSDLAPAPKRKRRKRRPDEGQLVAMMGALTAVMLLG